MVWAMVAMEAESALLMVTGADIALVGESVEAIDAAVWAGSVGLLAMATEAVAAV